MVQSWLTDTVQLIPSAVTDPIHLVQRDDGRSKIDGERVDGRNAERVDGRGNTDAEQVDLRRIGPKQSMHVQSEMTKFVQSAQKRTCMIRVEEKDPPSAKRDVNRFETLCFGVFAAIGKEL